MKFNLRATGYFYHEEDMEPLEALGFQFARFSELPPEEAFGEYDGYQIRTDITIEFANLQELVRFSEQHGKIIVDGDSIEIYDDYRE